MNSIPFIRKYAFVTLIRRNHVVSSNKRCKSNITSGSANDMEKINEGHEGDLNRIVTRSYSKKLSEKDNNSTMPLVVGHDKDEKEFYIKMTEDHTKPSPEKAILTYEWERPRFVDLQHTYVPPEFRGKGVAGLLAETAFEYFVSEGATMRLTCSYLQKYAIENDNPRIKSNICWN